MSRGPRQGADDGANVSALSITAVTLASRRRRVIRHQMCWAHYPLKTPSTDDPSARVENVPMIVKRSALSFGEAVERVGRAIEQRGLTVFAQFDHAAGARGVGLELADEQVLVFGNPRAGTPLMQADPRVGIELPLRMLVWSDAEGVAVGYRDPRELAGSYDVAQHAETLERMAALLGDIATEVAA
jgi:uncharacterized protein (DUF302 family)